MANSKLGYKPREVTIHGERRWRIAYEYVTHGNGNRTARFYTYKTKEEALTKQSELLRIQAQGDEFAGEAFQISNNFSVAACAEELKAVGATIREATDYYLNTRFAKKGVVTAYAAAHDFLADKLVTGLETSTEINYKDNVRKFGNHFGEKPVASITKDDLEEYFGEIGKYSNNNTKRQLKRWAIAMFNWFVEQDYIALPYGAKNEAQKMAVPRHEPKTPKLATWQSVHDLLYWLDQRGKQVGGRNKGQTYDTLFYFCCCMFLGIRMKEAYAITWDDVLWDTKELTVLCEDAKVDKRRVNEMPDNFWAWLKYLRGKAVLNTEGDASRRCSRIVKHYREHLTKLGKPIPDLIAVKESLNPKAKLQEKFHNIKRHTFCGNHLRLHKNSTKTATLMGNSPKQVEGAYKQLVKHKQDAVMFFNIKPPVALTDEEFQESFGGEESVTLEEAVEAYLSHDRVKQMLGDYGDKYVDKDLTDSLKYYEKLIIRFLTVKTVDHEGKEISYLSDEKEDELTKALEWETSPVRVGRGIKVMSTSADYDADKDNEKKIYESVGEIVYDEKVKQKKVKKKTK
jgi:integrase